MRRQTFIKHFSCRRLSQDLAVLEADYNVECYPDEIGSMWWLLAAASVLGLAIVSLGLPVGMFLTMYRDLSAKFDDVRRKKLTTAVAYRNHGRRYEYMCGEFRPQACECTHDTPPAFSTTATAAVPPDEPSIAGSAWLRMPADSFCSHPVL